MIPADVHHIRAQAVEAASGDGPLAKINPLRPNTTVPAFLKEGSGTATELEHAGFPGQLVENERKLPAICGVERQRLVNQLVPRARRGDERVTKFE